LLRPVEPTRILILYALSEAPRNVSELTKELGCNQPTISRHLKVLRDRGLVLTSRQGTTITYQISDARLIEALDVLRSIMRDQLTHQASLVSELG
jgi:ArsR family transcriptional regulator